MIGSKLSLTRRVVIAISVTTGVMLIAFCALSLWGWSRSGPVGLAAASLVCVVCWVSGLIALSAPLVFRDPQMAAQGLLFGMLFRMGLPLVVAVGLHQSRSELLKVGVMEMLVGVYLIGLLVETLLSWWIAETSAGASASRIVKAS
jgi:hypothetical protein